MIKKIKNYKSWIVNCFCYQRGGNVAMKYKKASKK